MNRKEPLTNRIAFSLVWKFLERGGIQVTQFVVSLIIARILGPDDYGVVAILTIFISIATVFVQSGLSTALIQKKDADELDYSSVFFYSLVLALFVYLVLFFGAPLVEMFYNNMRGLAVYLRIMALTLFPGALNSIQISFLSKQMQFKKQFISSMIAVVLSGGLGIILAIYSFGAWALIIQQLSYQIIICIVLWILVKWRPTRAFSFQRTKSLLLYGVKLLGARLIDTIYHNLESLIIGKKYNSEVLAFCNKGKQFPLTLIDNIDGSIQSVMLPAYSIKQDNLDALKGMLRRTISLSTYLVFPAMLGLALVGRPLIFLTLGDQWLECVPFLQLYCFISMLFPMQTANLQAINAIGRSDIYLHIMTIKRIAGVIILFIAVFFFDSVYAIVIACLITEVVGIIINIGYNKTLFRYTFGELLHDIIPNLLLSVGMLAIAYFPAVHIKSDILHFAVNLFLGVVSYILMSIIVKNDNWKYIVNKIRNRHEHEEVEYPWQQEEKARDKR